MRAPLWLQVVAAVLLGSAVGVWAGREPIVFGIDTEALGMLGMLVIRLLKALALPLIVFMILDALLRFSFPGHQVRRLLATCGVNVTVALAIGIALVAVFEPGRRLAPYFAAAEPGAGEMRRPPAPDPLSTLDALVPDHVLEPIEGGSVMSAVLLALLAGFALRRVRARQQSQGDDGHRAVEGFIRTGAEALVQALSWVILAVPYAAFGLVAQAVGRSGLGVFADLWIFLAVILAGMTLHALVWYPLVAWVVSRRTPRQYLRGVSEPVVTAIATNSSLATVPVTLRALGGMGVNDEAARLAACAATNLNNDGITLYEVMAALIIVQACGMEASVGAQLSIALAAIAAAAGIAGIPEAGLVVLPVVLSAAGLSEALIAVAVPLVVPVDWILARCRSVVNVMSDMIVALSIDAGRSSSASLPPSAPTSRPHTARVSA